ncbi:MAG: hypothetical protein BWK72_00095 [Rhodoferax ferrireducens]|uniref:Uncharacterized protein n=1 Tax=Rhodoferax ferrireducens TaxID=192843 RepID=A0A1W9KYC3_9BURK|nr:MAG: hypothetical protein BWK72_00095 [Rhodoferax ferrireducens]
MCPSAVWPRTLLAKGIDCGCLDRWGGFTQTDSLGHIGANVQTKMLAGWVHLFLDENHSSRKLHSLIVVP